MDPYQAVAFAFFLGVIYYYTRSGQAHYNKAMSLLHRQENKKAIKELIIASKKGYVEAMYQIGSICVETDNYPEAIKWLKNASEKSHAKAQTKL